MRETHLEERKKKAARVKIWFPSRWCHNLSVYPGLVYYFSPFPSSCHYPFSCVLICLTVTSCLRQQPHVDGRRPQNQELLTAAVRAHLSVACASVYARVSARMFTPQHNTTAQRWRLPWVISRVSRGVRQLSLQPGQRKHVDIYLFHSSVFRFPLRTCLSNFKRATLTF